MEIIFKEENGKLFGSTKFIGIGKRQPKLIYGEQAKKLREQAGLTIEQLANEFKENYKMISEIEEQKRTFNEKMFKKYKDKFGVEKEYFFDLDLETLILSAEGHIIKSFNNSSECLKKYNEVMEDYFNAYEDGKTSIKIDFEMERGNE